MLHNLRIAIEEEFGTQIACAKAIGLHPIRLNRICCGWIEPTPIERDRLASALAADPQWLFSRVLRIPRPPAESVAAIA